MKLHVKFKCSKYKFVSFLLLANNFSDDWGDDWKSKKKEKNKDKDNKKSKKVLSLNQFIKFHYFLTFAQ